jgi:hypothetical protein
MVHSSCVSPLLALDDNGKLTSDGTRSYTWDARNQLTGISGSVGELRLRWTVGSGNPGDLTWFRLGARRARL